MLNEQKTGPVISSDGSIAVARIDKQGAGVRTQAHGAYAEASQRGNIFFSYCVALTATVPATSIVGNFVWNPPDSGIVMSLLKWSAQIEVGSSAAELGMSLCYSAEALTPHDTPVDADSSGCTYLSASSPRSGKAKAYNDADVTVAPTPVMNLFHITAAKAGTGVDQLGGDFHGIWTIPPGYLVAILAYVNEIDTIGMTNTLTWEEIPIS